MLKMALNAFWWVAENIWKMTPPEPPSPPSYGKFHMFFADTFWKLPLVTRKVYHKLKRVLQLHDQKWVTTIFTELFLSECPFIRIQKSQNTTFIRILFYCQDKQLDWHFNPYCQMFLGFQSQEQLYNHRAK